LPIHRTFPLSEIAEALATMAANRHLGKIVITTAQ
jgi:NADPH:quinone reductase-like Zn-dependent oxidoreductase